jgi:hypothetical protein
MISPNRCWRKHVWPLIRENEENNEKSQAGYHFQLGFNMDTSGIPNKGVTVDLIL